MNLEKTHETYFCGRNRDADRKQTCGHAVGGKGKVVNRETEIGQCKIDGVEPVAKPTRSSAGALL